MTVTDEKQVPRKQAQSRPRKRTTTASTAKADSTGRPRAGKIGKAIKSGRTIDVYEAMAVKVGELLDHPELKPNEAAPLMRRLQELTELIEAQRRTGRGDPVRSASEKPDEKVNPEEM